MRFLLGDEKKKAMEYIDEAVEVALGSLCLRSRCGSVIVDDNSEIIGRGYNSPPLDKILMHCFKDDLPADFKSDKTCCVHAEQRAIMDALRNNPDDLLNSTLYFIRLDENGNKVFAGEPYCTICSKMALDVGIGEFVLWRNGGFCAYETEEYNRLSFRI